MADTDQDHLPGTNYAKVKFVGMAFEQVDCPDLLDEVVFKVTGRVVSVGREVMKDDVRRVAKIQVTAVEQA